jgi:hypothetical protein
MAKTNPIPYTITVGPTQTDPACHLSYTDQNGRDVCRLSVNTNDAVSWTLPSNFTPKDPSDVHMFIYFPPGHSPFGAELFHTTGSAPTAAATVISKPKGDYDYCVLIVDLNEMPPRVLNDDPVIAHSGSGIVRQPLETTLAVAAEIEAKAREIRRIIEEAIEMGDEIR